MDQSRITFTNNESIIVKEGDFFMPINLIDDNGESFTSQGQPIEIYNSNHDGLIPSITELCLKSSFFSHIDNPNKVYKSSSVVSIENI